MLTCALKVSLLLLLLLLLFSAINPSVKAWKFMHCYIYFPFTGGHVVIEPAGDQVWGLLTHKFVFRSLARARLPKRSGYEIGSLTYISLPLFSVIYQFYFQVASIVRKIFGEAANFTIMWKYCENSRVIRDYYVSLLQWVKQKIMGSKTVVTY